MNLRVKVSEASKREEERPETASMTGAVASTKQKLWSGKWNYVGNGRRRTARSAG